MILEGIHNSTMEMKWLILETVQFLKQAKTSVKTNRVESKTRLIGKH